MEIESRANYVFYIKYGKELTKDFFYFAKLLAEKDIKLVPVSPRELTNLSSGQKKYILSCVTDLSKRKLFTQIRKKWLDFGMLSKRYCLFDVSSFNKFETAYQVERVKTYYHYKLPIPLSEVVDSIAKAYFGEQAKEKSWPGGRKARLPA